MSDSNDIIVMRKRRKAKKDFSSFNTWISRLATLTLENNTLSPNVKAQIDTLVKVLVNYLLEVTEYFVEGGKRKTILPSDIYSAAKVANFLEDGEYNVLLQFIQGGGLKNLKILKKLERVTKGSETSYIEYFFDGKDENMNNLYDVVKNVEKGQGVRNNAIIFSPSRLLKIMRAKSNKNISKYSPVLLAHIIDKFLINLMQSLAEVKEISSLRKDMKGFVKNASQVINSTDLSYALNDVVIVNFGDRYAVEQKQDSKIRDLVNKKLDIVVPGAGNLNQYEVERDPKASKRKRKNKARQVKANNLSYKSSSTTISKAAFERYVRNYLEKQGQPQTARGSGEDKEFVDVKHRLSKEAICALHLYIDQYSFQLLEKASKVVRHSDRKTLMAKDIELVSQWC